MIAIAFHFICVVCACFKSRRRLEAEILVLRHQLNVLQHAAATTSRHACMAEALKARCVLAEVRWRWTLKVL